MKVYDKKIDIYTYNFSKKFWEYTVSTNTYKTCKEAKASFLKKYNFLTEDTVKANFSTK